MRVSWVQGARSGAGGAYALLALDLMVSAVGGAGRGVHGSGLTVVLLAHSNNDGTFGGAVEWRKASRCIYGIHGKAPSATRFVKTMNNKDNLPEFNVTLAEDGTRLIRCDEASSATAGGDDLSTRRQGRTRGVSKNNQRLEMLKSRDDWASQGEAAEALGLSPATVSRLLGRTGHKFKDGAFVPSGWVKPGEAA